MSADPVTPLTVGAIIRRQRQLLSLPLRQLASMAGISNAYLSQIERNLRDPSDRVLNAIATELQLSTDDLTAEASDATSAELSDVVAAIRRDTELTRSQRRTLEEMYETFRDVTRQGRRRPHLL
jgi:transcriptional regulator with XRE-family HTH domain